MKKSLEKLLQNLEKLSKNSTNNINDIINKIDENYRTCKNELQIMKSNKKIIINDQSIKSYLDKIKSYKSKTNQYFHKLFQQTEVLLLEIKQFNLQQNNNIVNESNYLMNNNITNNNINNQSAQLEVMLQKEQIIQAQNLKLLNDNQGRALAALECYANRFTENNKTNFFDYYNMNNFGNKKDINQLRGQCIVQTQLFRMTYMDYTQKYGEYKIDNINNEKLLEIINNWMNKVNDKDKIIYQEMIDIIKPVKITASSSNSFNHYSKNCQNAIMDPKDIACMAPGIYNYNHQRSKEAKKNYIETKKMDSNLIIGQSYKDDKNAQILMEQIKDNEEYYKEQDEIKRDGYK